MSNETVIPVSRETAAHALVDQAGYAKMYAVSVNDPDAFWGEHGKRITWIKPYTRVKNTRYDGDV
jgi:acetyl-CoA synthetase